MNIRITNHTKEDLKDIKEGLEIMFFGYFSSIEAINETEKEQVEFSYYQIREAIKEIIDKKQ